MVIIFYILTKILMDYNFLIQSDLKMLSIIKDFVSDYWINLGEKNNFLKKEILYKDFINYWKKKKVNTEEEFKEYKKWKERLFNWSYSF